MGHNFGYLKEQLRRQLISQRRRPAPSKLNSAKPSSSDSDGLITLVIKSSANSLDNVLLRIKLSLETP